MSIIIDNVRYDVGIYELEALAEQLDKYAERTVNGDLLHEVIGTYYIFTVRFCPIVNPRLHNDFWEDLNAPKRERTVTLPGGLTTHTFQCYIRTEPVSMRRHESSGNMYGGITAKFTPIKPSRRG